MEVPGRPVLTIDFAEGIVIAAGVALPPAAAEGKHLQEKSELSAESQDQGSRSVLRAWPICLRLPIA